MDLPNPGIEPGSPALQADSLPTELPASEAKSLSRVLLFATPWTVTYQAPLSMGFSRQEYWSGLPFPSPGDLPDPGIKPGSPADRHFTIWATREVLEGRGRNSNVNSETFKGEFKCICNRLLLRWVMAMWMFITLFPRHIYVWNILSNFFFPLGGDVLNWQERCKPMGRPRGE